jgi:hypothetical protein
MQYKSQKGEKDRQDIDIYKEGTKGSITYTTLIKPNTTLIKPNLHPILSVVPICQEVPAYDHHAKHR